MDIISLILQIFASYGITPIDTLTLMTSGVISLALWVYYYTSLLDPDVRFHYLSISDTFIPSKSSPLRWLPFLLHGFLFTFIAIMNSQQFEVRVVGCLQFVMLYLTQIVLEIQTEIHGDKIIQITESDLPEQQKTILKNYSILTIFGTYMAHGIVIISLYLFYAYQHIGVIDILLMISLIVSGILRYTIVIYWPIERIKAELEPTYPIIAYGLTVIANTFVYCELIMFVFMLQKNIIYKMFENKQFAYAFVSSIDLDVTRVVMGRM